MLMTCVRTPQIPRYIIMANRLLWLLPLLLWVQCTSARKYNVLVSGAQDDPTVATDDGGKLTNGRYRVVDFVNGANQYMSRSVISVSRSVDEFQHASHPEAACTITLQPAYASGSSWVVS